MRRCAALLTLAVPALVLPLLACGRGRPPNVVLIVVDSLSAEALGAQGGLPSASPRIDRLAADGVRFERAVATASWNMPSLSSLVTSTQPWRHGQGTAAGQSDVATLAEVFAKAGYRTAAFTETAWPLLQRGFDVFENTAGSDTFGDPKANSAAKTLASALAWAREDDARPFFLLVHSYEVHSYFLGKPEHHAYARRDQAAYAGPFREWGTRDLAQPAGAQVIDSLLDANEDDMAYVRALYRGALAGLDAEIGRFVDGLAAAGLERRTVFALTSTNGEGFRPDLKRVHHGGRLHDDVLHVPFFVRWPGRLEPAASSSLVSTLDVAPTLAKLAGVGSEPRFEGRALVAADTSFASRFRGSRFLLPKLPSQLAFAHEGTFRVLPSGQRATARGPQLALYSDWVTLIADGEDVRLYDLKADPRQEKDLAAAHPDVVASLRDELRRVAEEAGRAGGPDSATLERLRSLGYVQ